MRSLQGRDEEDVSDERGKDDVYRDFGGTSLTLSGSDKRSVQFTGVFGVVSSLFDSKRKLNAGITDKSKIIEEVRAETSRARTF